MATTSVVNYRHNCLHAQGQTTITPDTTFPLDVRQLKGVHTKNFYCLGNITFALVK